MPQINYVKCNCTNGCRLCRGEPDFRIRHEIKYKKLEHLPCPYEPKKT